MVPVCPCEAFSAEGPNYTRPGLHRADRGAWRVVDTARHASSEDIWGSDIWWLLSYQEAGFWSAVKYSMP
jgi:hypothetical protein